MVVDQVPKCIAFEIPLVKAKIGPSVTLLCDDKVFKTTTKDGRVELAGIFIVGIKSVKK